MSEDVGSSIEKDVVGGVGLFNFLTNHLKNLREEKEELQLQYKSVRRKAGPTVVGAVQQSFLPFSFPLFFFFDATAREEASNFKR